MRNSFRAMLSIAAFFFAQSLLAQKTTVSKPISTSALAQKGAAIIEKSVFEALKIDLNDPRSGWFIIVDDPQSQVFPDSLNRRKKAF